MKVNRR